MERDDNILEEYNVFISERDSKARNDARKNIQQLSRSVELVSLMNQREEHFVDRFADHLASGYELNNYAGKWLHLLLRRACARYSSDSRVRLTLRNQTVPGTLRRIEE